MADLSSKRYSDTYKHFLVSPDGEKLDTFVELAGPAHPVRTAYDGKNYRRKAREFNRKGKQQLNEDAEETKDELVARIATYTLNWGNLELDGQPVPFSPDAARRLYSDDAFGWVLVSVAQAADAAENFMRSSSSN